MYPGQRDNKCNSLEVRKSLKCQRNCQRRPVFLDQSKLERVLEDVREVMGCDNISLIDQLNLDLILMVKGIQGRVLK